MDARLMDDNGKCHACNVKRKKTTSLVQAATVVDVSPADAENDDPLSFARKSKNAVRLQIEDKMAQHGGINGTCSSPSR